MTDRAPEESQAATNTGRFAPLIGLIGIGIMVVVFAFGAGRLTAPAGEEAVVVAQPTTATTRVDVAVGEPMAWEQTADIGETWPTAIVENDGTVYLFGARESPFVFEPMEGSGLDAWTSADGSSWNPVGTVIPAPAFVHGVVSTPQGLLAYGTDGADGAPHIWMSTDGTNWTISELPTPEPQQPGTDMFLEAAGANDEAVVVFGQSFFNPDQALFDALPEEVRLEGGEHYGLSYGGPPFAVTIHGPLGLAVYSATAEELGLTDEQVDALMFGGPFEEEMVTLWHSPDGQSWTTSQIEAGHIGQVWTNADGDLVATGHGFFGPVAWTSSNGIDWEARALTGEVDIRQPWQDGVVGVRYFGPGEELVYSHDGEEWSTLGAEALLPERLSWSYHPLAAGGGGIATVARGYDEFMDMGFEEPEPVVLEKDGYTLTVEEHRGVLLLTRGNEEVLRLPLHTERVHEGVSVDFAARTLGFLDPATGETVVTFTFDEIEAAQEAVFEGFPMQMENRVFMFSPDGAVWTAHGFDELFGAETDLSELLVLDDRVIGVVADLEHGFTGPPPVPTVFIWTALVP